MLEISGDVLPHYVAYITGASAGFIPLVATVAGTFLAFAIANMLVFFVKKSAKKA